LRRGMLILAQQADSFAMNFDLFDAKTFE
jgi:hypothetical protein